MIYMSGRRCPMPGSGLAATARPKEGGQPIVEPFEPAGQDRGPDEGMPEPQDIQTVDQALEQIDRLLHQMLLLAGLSASDADVDRARLQQALDRLRNKIDRIADSIR